MNEQDEVDKLINQYLKQSRKLRQWVTVSSILICGLGIFLLAYYIYLVTNDFETFRSTIIGFFSSAGLILVGYMMWRNEERSHKKTIEIYEKYKKSKE